MSQYDGTDTTVIPFAGELLPLVMADRNTLIFPNGTALQLGAVSQGPIPAAAVSDYPQVPGYYLGIREEILIPEPIPDSGYDEDYENKEANPLGDPPKPDEIWSL